MPTGTFGGGDPNRSGENQRRQRGSHPRRQALPVRLQLNGADRIARRHGFAIARRRRFDGASLLFFLAVSC